jgi:hypothetical protein
MNRLPLLLISILIIAGCGKNEQQQTACPTNQACTMVFASFNIHFTDNAGNPVNVSNFSAYNQRTKTNLIVSTTQPAALGAYIVANDNMRDQLLTEGDNILISGTYTATGQTKTTVVNISGGCNCHVAKTSGVDVIKFD